MSCNIMVGAWISFLFLLLLFALFQHLIFLRFCKSIAVLRGRESEYQSSATNNDVGTNKFVREQFERISHVKFDDIDNEDLIVLGLKIRRKVGLQIILLIVLIAFGVWIQSKGCF